MQNNTPDFCCAHWSGHHQGNLYSQEVYYKPYAVQRKSKLATVMQDGKA